MAATLRPLAACIRDADSAARCKGLDGGCKSRAALACVGLTMRNGKGTRRRGRVVASSDDNGFPETSPSNAQDAQGGPQGPPQQELGKLKDTTKIHMRGQPGKSGATVQLSNGAPPAGEDPAVAKELILWKREESARRFQRSEWEREKAVLAEEAAMLRERIQAAQDQLCRIHLGGQLITPPPINNPVHVNPSLGTPDPPPRVRNSEDSNLEPARMFKVRDVGRVCNGAPNSAPIDGGPAWERRRRVENVANQVLDIIMERLKSN